MLDFSRLQAHMDMLHDECGIPTCDVIVCHEGKPVYRYMTGMANLSHRKTVGDDTLYFLYSCTKPITAAAGMQLVERGVISLDDPVAAYLPEYANAFILENGSKVTVGREMTIRHLFTMSAGLTYDLGSSSISDRRAALGNKASTRNMVPAFIQEPLSFRPGERFQYSLCLDVLAAVIEVASGRSFGKYLKENIFDPLGMTDTGFHPNAEQAARIADQYAAAQDGTIRSIAKSIGGFRITEAYESGGAGLFSSTADYAKFAVAMSLGGISPEGVRILKPETVKQMSAQQMGSYVVCGNFSCAAGPGYGYGLGVRTLIDRSAGQRSHLGEIGWDGAAGAYILMDPDAKMAIVYMQHVREWPNIKVPTGHIHIPIRDLAYDILGV